MVRRFFPSLCVIAVLAASPSHAVPTCSRDLHAVLESPACVNHWLLIASQSRTIINTTIIGAVCVDFLHALLTSAESTPCTAKLVQGPTHRTRQLTANSGPFEGELKCTFDMSAPLNVSNLSQSFIIDCEEINKSDYSWLYYTFGVVGAGIVLVGLAMFWQWLKATIEKRAERRRQDAVDKTESPSTGHPDALA